MDKKERFITTILTGEFLKSVRRSEEKLKKKRKRNLILFVIALTVASIAALYLYVKVYPVHAEEVSTACYIHYEDDNRVVAQIEREIDSIIFDKKHREIIKEKYQQKMKADFKEDKIKKETLAKKEREQQLAKIKANREKNVASAEPNRGGEGKDVRGTFNLTGYDLSVQSCGKKVGSKGYGITASGYSLVGHTRESAMAVAADKNMFAFGTRLELTFITPGYEKYNGIYTVRDRGGAIKGNRIDVFMGDFNKNEVEKSVMAFGRPQAKIKIVE